MLIIRKLGLKRIACLTRFIEYQKKGFHHSKHMFIAVNNVKKALEGYRTYLGLI